MSETPDQYRDAIEKGIENFLKPFASSRPTGDTERALRYNDGKPRWGLVDFQSLISLVSVLEFGEAKYGTCNWKKGAPTVEICESMLRHIFAFLSGEDNDSESGLPHTGHIQFNAMMLDYIMKNRRDFDNRNKYNVVLSEKESDHE